MGGADNELSLYKRGDADNKLSLYEYVLDLDIYLCITIPYRQRTLLLIFIQHTKERLA